VDTSAGEGTRGTYGAWIDAFKRVINSIKIYETILNNFEDVPSTFTDSILTFLNVRKTTSTFAEFYFNQIQGLKGHITGQYIPPHPPLPHFASGKTIVEINGIKYDIGTGNIIAGATGEETIYRPYSPKLKQGWLTHLVAKRGAPVSIEEFATKLSGLGITNVKLDGKYFSAETGDETGVGAGAGYKLYEVPPGETEVARLFLDAKRRMAGHEGGASHTRRRTTHKKPRAHRRTTHKVRK
jgi:hypothetical protein